MRNRQLRIEGLASRQTTVWVINKNSFHFFTFGFVGACKIKERHAATMGKKLFVSIQSVSEHEYKLSVYLFSYNVQFFYNCWNHLSGAAGFSGMPLTPSSCRVCTQNNNIEQPDDIQESFIHPFGTRNEERGTFYEKNSFFFCDASEQWRNTYRWMKMKICVLRLTNQMLRIFIPFMLQSFDLVCLHSPQFAWQCIARMLSFWIVLNRSLALIDKPKSYSILKCDDL